MKNIIAAIGLCAVVICLGTFNSCYSDNFEPDPIIIDPVDTISFSLDIVPFFVSSCANNSFCHVAGGANPDLTPQNAYQSIISGGFVDLNEPTNSEFYKWLVGSGGRLVMPPSGTIDELNTNFIGWVSQGTLNN